MWLNVTRWPHLWVLLPESHDKDFHQQWWQNNRPEHRHVQDGKSLGEKPSFWHPTIFTNKNIMKTRTWNEFRSKKKTKNNTFTTSVVLTVHFDFNIPTVTSHKDLPKSPLISAPGHTACYLSLLDINSRLINAFYLSATECASCHLKSH